jgi:hypothetical protein
MSIEITAKTVLELLVRVAKQFITLAEQILKEK